MLPTHVKLERCVPDPHGRANHILHPATRHQPEEVFHVDQDTYRQVLTAHRSKLAVEEPDVEEEEIPDEEATSQAAENPHGITTAEEVTDAPDRAELLSMAEVLNIPVTDETTDAELLSAIESAVVSEGASHTTEVSA